MKKMSNIDSAYTFEYIGAQIQVSKTNHEGYKDIEGIVVDETKNTFTIRDGEKKIVPKKGNVFKVKIDEEWNTLDGLKLTCRPENRIKKLG